MTFGKEGDVGGKGKFRPLFEKDANVGKESDTKFAYLTHYGKGKRDVGR